MSEQINKVLASTAQSFTTGEKKQARDNIDAQQAGDYVSASTFNAFSAHVDSAKQDASAMSSYVPYSAISADANSAITSINGSSVGKFTGVSAGDNLSGNGLSSSPLGLNSSIVFTASNRQNTVQADKMEFTAKVNPLVFSGTYRPWGWDISGSSTSTNEKTAVVQNTSYFSMYTTSDGSEKAQGYLTFRGCGFGESGTGGAGDEIHTNISTLGITSISGYMGTASSHTGFYLTNGNDPDRPLELKFESGSSTAKVDIDSIDRWNSYSAGSWNESGNSLSTGFGGNQVTAASQYNAGAGNWACRTVKMSGLPDQNLYGFQSKPQGTATAYMVNPAGAFIQYQPTYFCKLYHKTGSVYEDLGTSIYPTGLTGDARLDFVNLCSGCSANIMTDTFHGTTATFDPGQSATMWYIASADIWTDGHDDVPV